MGAGATAGVQTLIDEAELKEALSSLSLEEKCKFWDAVGASGAQAAVDENAKLKEEFGKLSAEKQSSFTDAISKALADPAVGAPYLELATEYGTKFYAEYFKDMSPEEQAAIDADPAKKKEIGDAWNAYFDSDMKPIYDKVFARHDINKNGTIARNEAGDLFSNLLKVWADGIAAGAAQFAESVAITILGEGTHPDEKKAAVVEKVTAAGKPLGEAIMKAYSEKKSEMDDAAFKVLDPNGEGAIKKEAFYELFKDKSEVQKKWTAIMGCGEEQVMEELCKMGKAE